jgi:hypothetical protein
MPVQRGVDVAVMFLVCGPVTALALCALIAWLILQNHYHH